jgi:hypothetical protein
MNNRRGRAALRRFALFGCFAVLFQALLFGWHHHDLTLTSHGMAPAAHGSGEAPFSPATAEDDCDICQALHHLRTAPGEFVRLPPPSGPATVLALATLVLQHGGFSRAFRARAPPRA